MMKRALLVLAMVSTASIALGQEGTTTSTTTTTTTVDAHSDVSRNFLQLGVMRSDPSKNHHLDFPGGVTGDFQIDKDDAPYVNYERRLNNWLGLSFGTSVSHYDMDLFIGGEGGEFGELKSNPITGNLLIHPIPPDSAFDIYFGAGVAYVLYQDVDVDPAFRGLLGENSVATDDDLTWGAQAGMNIKFGDSHLGLGIDAKYVSTSLEDELKNIDLNPIQYGVGLLIHW